MQDLCERSTARDNLDFTVGSRRRITHGACNIDKYLPLLGLQAQNRMIPKNTATPGVAMSGDADSTAVYHLAIDLAWNIGGMGYQGSLSWRM